MLNFSIGFGTYKASEESISLALEAGYRYFDTASVYGTEGYLGAALRKSGVKREDVFITSKVWRADMGHDKVMAAFSRSLEAIGTDYLDGYMIHWPCGKELDLETWRAMEELCSQGRIRALGLSNFLPYHADYIIAGCEVQPSFAQLEFHPGYMQPFALEYYRRKNILVQAWSPTARGRIFGDVLIQELTVKYGINPVQLCLAFCASEGVMPLPKASSIERLRENMEAVKIVLEPEDVSRIENMPPLGWGGEHPDRERVSV